MGLEIGPRESDGKVREERQEAESNLESIFLTPLRLPDQTCYTTLASSVWLQTLHTERMRRT